MQVVVLLHLFHHHHLQAMHSERILIFEPESSKLRKAGVGAYGNIMVRLTHPATLPLLFVSGLWSLPELRQLGVCGLCTV